jgi:hypothetical protein
VKPDVVYIDADHHYEAAKSDIKKALELFPEALLVGDDYGNYEDVRRAVHECANEFMKTGLVSSSAPSLSQLFLFPCPRTVHVDNNHCWTYCCVSSSTGQNIPPKISTGKSLSTLMNRFVIHHLSFFTFSPDTSELGLNHLPVPLIFLLHNHMERLSNLLLTRNPKTLQMISLNQERSKGHHQLRK